MKHASQSYRPTGSSRPVALARHPVAAALAAAFCAVPSLAPAQLPTGASIVHGAAGIVTRGNAMTVTNTPNAIVNWNSFSVGAQNSVRFEQQNAASQVLNRVVGNDPSSILGSLSSNGGVWLVNPHGVLFGPNARIDVGGLVASTLGISNDDFLAGRFRFEREASLGGQVLNQGEIHTTFGGRVWLMGDSVRNEGLVQSPGGNIVLGAGKSIELVDSGMPNVIVRITAPESEALNLGSLLASAGGNVDLHGGIVNQRGIVRADSVGTDAAGRVVIRAQGDVKLEDSSVTSASNAGSGAAGTLLAESATGTTVISGEVLAKSAGTRGGQIQLLGRNVGVFDGAEVDASGYGGGGQVLVGGDYQGKNPAVANAGAIYLGPTASVRANATHFGDGGKAIFWGNDAARIYGTIEARGGPKGGDGGFIETSARYLDARPKSVDAGAPSGNPGKWLLDPYDITIVESDRVELLAGDESTSAFQITSTANVSQVAAGTIERQLNNGTSVVVQTGDFVCAGCSPDEQDGDITVGANITLVTDSLGSLTLNAHNNITVNTGIAIQSLNGSLPVTLNADADANGAGTIRMSGGSNISTRGGNITMSGAGISIDGGSLDAGRIFLTSRQNTTIDNARLTAFGGGDAITIAADRVITTASTLSAPEGRWLIYLGPGRASTFQTDLGGLGYQFVQVNAPRDTALDSSLARQDGVLLQDPLNVRVKVNAARTYDQTTRATFDNFVENDAPAGFRLQTNASAAGDPRSPAEGTFDTKDVGVDKTINFSGNEFLLTTTGNVPVFGSTLSYVGDITPKIISQVGVTATSRVYDGTEVVTLAGAPSGVIAGDNVILNGATGRLDDKNVGNSKFVTISGGSLTGIDSRNYVLSGNASTTADITARPISAAGLTADDKVYDGTRSATIRGGALSQAIAGDDVALDGATGLFDTKNVGNDKLVTISGGSLAGTDSPNYVLSSDASTTANITARPITIGMDSEKNNRSVVKEYDTTTAAALASNLFTLNNVVPDDAISIAGPTRGSYDSADVGNQKVVTATGDFQISGSDATNYSIRGVTFASRTSNTISDTVSGKAGAITPATLSYNADRAVRPSGMPVVGLTGSVSGFKGADDLTSATVGIASWKGQTPEDLRPGTYAIEGRGLSAANYVFTQAPGNASALVLVPVNIPDAPQRKAVESSASAIDAAISAVLAAVSLKDASESVFDISSPTANRAFNPVDIASMSQDALAQMLESRKDFKRKLFADAIYKLEIDPSLADVQPCATAADVGSGLCRITTAQLDEIHARKAPQENVQKSVKARTASLPQIERKIAVLFGINDYDDKKIPRLENAVPDVEAVSKMLQDKLGYEVKAVRNPNKADIIRTLNELATQINSSDSVVVYYAGHGYSLDKNGAGYWLPSDAPVSDPSKWISNSDIAKLLAGIRSKQMALISDSCYSGAFARDGMASVGREVTAEDVLTKRSVVVLSSGGDEPVTDEGKDGHSIFAWNLMKAMGSVDNWRPGSTIFDEVQREVKKEFPQTPRYGSVTSAGHQQGGDYLFELR